MDGETALGIVDKAEIFTGFFNRDDVHEARGVGGIGTDFAVDSDESLHHDGFGFAGVESVLESAGGTRVNPSFFEIDNVVDHTDFG